MMISTLYTPMVQKIPNGKLLEEAEGLKMPVSFSQSLKIVWKGIRFSSKKDFPRACDECAVIPNKTLQSWLLDWFQGMEK